MTCGESLSHVWQAGSLHWDLSGPNIWHMRSFVPSMMDSRADRGAREAYPASTRGYRVTTGKYPLVSSVFPSDSVLGMWDSSDTGHYPTFLFS
jgi:hypothetical protein